MRTIFKKSAVALLDNTEDQLAAAAAAAPADAAPADNANSLETDLVEVADSEAEGAENETALDEAVDTKEALEQYIAALEGYMTEGGIGKQAAHFLQIGAGFIGTRQNFRAAERLTVATEAFDGASSKLRSNQTALEGLGEQLAKVWESIKAAIKRAIEWLVGHYNKVFGSAEKMEKRAKAIAEKANGVTGTAKETKFENERLVKALHVNGTVPAALSSALEVAHKAGEDVFGQVAAYGTTAGQAILDAMSKADGKIDDIKAPAMSAPTMKALSAGDAKAAGFEDAPEGMSLYRSAQELPGGKAILGRYPSTALTGKAAADGLAKTSAAIVSFNNKAPAPSKSEVQTLAAAEIGKVAGVVETLARSVIAFRAKTDKANEIKTKILAAADKLSKASAKEEDADKKEYQAALQKLASASVNVVDKPAPQMAQYLLITGKAALDYCEESLKQYGGK